MTRKLAYWEPEDVPGNCNARLRLGDMMTNLCRLPADHEGCHESYYNGCGNEVVTTWVGQDEPSYDDCSCGCGYPGEAYCDHEFVAGECTECGMTLAEHAEVIARRGGREEP